MDKKIFRVWDNDAEVSEKDCVVTVVSEDIIKAEALLKKYKSNFMKNKKLEFQEIDFEELCLMRRHLKFDIIE